VAFVTVDGTRFHVQRLRGSGVEDGDATPAVMLHGLFTGSLASWFFTCAPALARTRPVFLYDLRGHGRSDRPPTGYSSAVQAADLDALTADFVPFVLVGHSFGAAIAVRFARRHPDRVAALALVEPPLVTKSVRAWWRVSREELESMAHSDDRPRRAAAARLAIDDTTMVDEIRSEPPLIPADLSMVPVPLLVALGRRSPGAAAADAVREVRPDAEVRVFDGGHSLHVDCTAELTDALVSFARRTDHEASTRSAVARG
jgi:pimeloyl-ACP methyl ester carboxylesterase